MIGDGVAIVLGPGHQTRRAYRSGGRVVIDDPRGVCKHVRSMLRRAL